MLQYHLFVIVCDNVSFAARNIFHAIGWFNVRILRLRVLLGMLVKVISVLALDSSRNSLALSLNLFNKILNFFIIFSRKE
jgi:hypothetical protein